MSEVTTVLADLDNTLLLPHAAYPSEETVLLARQASEAGLTCIAATERPLHMTQGLLASLGIDKPCIFDAGARVADPATGVTLWSRSLPPTVARRLAFGLLDHATTIDYGKGPFTTREVDLDDVTDETLQLYAAVPTPVAEKLRREILGYDHLAVIVQGGGGEQSTLAISHFEATRRRAAAEVLRLLGTTPQQTVVVSHQPQAFMPYAAGFMTPAGAASQLKTLVQPVAPWANAA